MNDASLTIARFTLLEAVRNRLFLFTVILLVCLFGLTEFIGELAITETTQIQAAVTGAILRLTAVFVISLFVITSMVREFNDKGLELVLSLPLRRGTYYLGKLYGYALLALVIAAMVAVPLMLYAEPLQLLLWTLSLYFELLIMIAVALFCLFTFGNITIAFSIVMAFYILSRSINTIILVSASPILETGSPAQEVINTVIRVIAACLPDLESFTRSEWLVYGGADISVLYPVIGQTLIYLVLLAAAALADLYRKNL